MTAEQYKKKLITYLERSIRLVECSKDVAQEKYEYYSKNENFDFPKIIENRAKVYGAGQRIVQLQNLISFIKANGIEKFRGRI